MLKFTLSMTLGLLLVLAPGGAMAASDPSSSSPASRFRLSAAPAAAVGYPMEVLDGRFSRGEGRGFPVAPGYLAGKWGLSAISWGVGDPIQPVPDRFWVRWYSYPEDKFYEGRFSLPAPHLAALLRQGYWNPQTGKSGTFDELTLCLLPGGVAVVWLTGINQVLVGRYQGREIAYDFQRFKPGADRSLMVTQERAKLPPAMQAEIASNRLGPSRWDGYLAAYPWKLAVSPLLRLTGYSLRLLSAERTVYPPSPDVAAHAQALLVPAARAVPASLALVVTAGDGRRRKIRVDAFDEAETMSAFKTLHDARPEVPLTLLAETDEQVTAVRFSVANGEQRIPLGQAKVSVFDAD